MKINNPNNFPQALVNAVSGGRDPQKYRMGVTDLIGSPWQRDLKLKYYDQVESDVEDMTWSMLGRAVHLLAEENSPSSAYSEIKLEVPYGDYKLVGIPDVHEDGVLDDYKVTSVYSFLLGEKIEWEQQLNVYRWMLHQQGITINTIRIIAILRDWMPRKAETEANYPRKPLIQVQIPIWDLEKAKAYIDERFKAHENIVPCTPEERWTRPTTYAAKIEGQKIAKRVLPSREEAEKWIKDNLNGKKAIIEERPGEDPKCKTYCSYAKFCSENRYNKVE